MNVNKTPHSVDIQKKMSTSAEEVANYLYKIDGEVTPEQYQAISTLRQLINECFYPKEQITNQFIYEQLKGIL